MVGRPDWLTPGAEVAVVRSRPGREYVKFATVDRVLKRDVVLDDGDRFNADRLSRSLGTWEGHEELLRHDDVRVVDALRRIAFRDDRVRVSTRLAADEREVRDAETAADLVDILRRLRMSLSLTLTSLGENVEDA